MRSMLPRSPPAPPRSAAMSPPAPSAATLVDFYLPEEAEAEYSSSGENDHHSTAAVGDVGYGFFAVPRGGQSCSGGAAAGGGSPCSSRRSTMSVPTTEEEEEEEEQSEESGDGKYGKYADLTHSHQFQQQQRFYRHSGEEVRFGRAGVPPASRFRPCADADAGRRPLLAFARHAPTPVPQQHGIPIPKTQNLFSQDRELREPSHTQGRPFSLGRMQRFRAGRGRAGGAREGGDEEEEEEKVKAMEQRDGKDAIERDSKDDAEEGIFDMEF
jgi:hypothetical protein